MCFKHANVMKVIHVYGDVAQGQTYIITFNNEYTNPLACDNLRIFVDAHLHGNAHNTDTLRVPKTVTSMKEQMHPLQTYDPQKYVVMVANGYDSDMSDEDVRILHVQKHKKEDEPIEFVSIITWRSAIVLFIWAIVLLYVQRGSYV